ncbi:MAG: hypothetical protein DWQ49_09545 [Bacteroidetes bacterium]|nr:MAG: hypothetical protein DWQ49_09545 [Bacteroidota bacterium]
MPYNLRTHKTGDTFEGATFTVTVNAAPLDLTGATLEMSVLRNDNKNPNVPKGKLVLQLDSGGNGLTITDAVNGIFDIDEQIINLGVGDYYYDIKFSLSDGSVKTYIGGCWTIVDKLDCA